MKAASIAVAATALLCIQPSFAGDGPDEDLGFNSEIGGTHVGFIASKVISCRDSDAQFVINNIPISYRSAPAIRFRLPKFEESLNAAIKIARDKSDKRSLALLLEGGACLLQKTNRFSQALNFLEELVDLEKQPDSSPEDLVAAESAYATVAQRMHLYSGAERALLDAIQTQSQAHGATDMKVAELKTSLFYLYAQMNKWDKAVAARKDSIKIAARDLVVEKDEETFRQDFHTWPLILNTLDSVSTAQSLGSYERKADDEALREFHKRTDEKKEAARKLQEKAKEMEREAREKKREQTKKQQASGQKDKDAGDKEPKVPKLDSERNIHFDSR